MRLRTKILSGFLILILMLFAAGSWSIYEMTQMGSSVQRLLDENYKSINAARMMMEAIERQDSAVLLIISGNDKQGKPILASGDELFLKGLDTAKTNITLDGEQACVETIEESYGSFKNFWTEFIINANNNKDLKWYYQTLHQAFLDTKLSVNKLMTLNDQAMYRTASKLQKRSYRVIMPGIVAIVSSVIFTLIFSYFINYYMVAPIIKITNGVKDFITTRNYMDISVETNDELSHLASAVKELCAISGAVQKT
ncbi:MAG: MCP four helix bundle domain-containing protein [Deltaproteobacteria bacterium]|nr:MCP four helix bundle domain-containing protein [Deltaproteobacteria bacterium]